MHVWITINRRGGAARPRLRLDIAVRTIICAIATLEFISKLPLGIGQHGLARWLLQQQLDASLAQFLPRPYISHSHVNEWTKLWIISVNEWMKYLSDTHCKNIRVWGLLLKLIILKTWQRVCCWVLEGGAYTQQNGRYWVHDVATEKWPWTQYCIL